MTTGPKGPRNKVKQVVLVNGHPHCIFEDIKTISYSLEFANGTIKMGNIGTNVAKELKAALIGSPLLLTEENKTKRRAIKLPGVLSVKTTPTNTMLTVGADTEENLNIKVQNIHEYLSQYDIGIQERCHWICTIDKKELKPEIKVPRVELNGTWTASTKDVAINLDLSKNPPKEKTYGTGPTRPLSEKTKKLQEMAIKMGVK